MAETVTIEITTESPEKIEVEAHFTRGGLAVHKPFEWGSEFRWCVTHVKSGMRVCGVKGDKRKATSVCNRLLALPFEWDRWKMASTVVRRAQPVKDQIMAIKREAEAGSKEVR